MKKFRILTPIMVATAAATPVVSLLTSCSKVDYASITAEMKETMIEEFISLSKVPRMTWMCHEISQHIQDRMEEFGFAAPTYEDNWSTSCDEVKAEIESTKKDNPDIPTEITRKHNYWGAYGNMWYDVPATKGLEDRPTIMIQAHMDMNIKWSTPEAKKKWLEKGVDVFYSSDREICEVNNGETPLGADNGAGLALLLSIAKHQHQFKHGKIRLMFTCEESGSAGSYDPKDPSKTYYVSGIKYLLNDQKNPDIPEDKKPLTGIDYILSTDGNVKGEIFTSVAGLHECVIERDNITPATPTAGSKQYELRVTGLSGGHSAYDINKGYGNALKMAMQILSTINNEDENDIWISSIDCPSGAYNICKEATIVFATTQPKEQIENIIKSYRDIYKSCYPIEGDLKIELWDETSTGRIFLSKPDSQSLCLMSNLLHFGPISWFDDLTHEIVKTSCNYGPLIVENYQDGGADKMKYKFHVVERSADSQQLINFKNLIHNYSKLILNVNDSNLSHIECPVWESSGNNKFADLVTEAYNTFNYKPKHTSSHAWIEMATFPEIYEAINKECPQMACIGPTILHSHETNEELFTDTLDSVIKGTLYTLEFSNKLKQN